MNYKFKDSDHKNFYEEWINKTNSSKDPYRKALFYTLGLTEETRNNINSLYNLKRNCVKFEGLNKGWQTGTTLRICRLAFNLYNGFCGTKNEDEEFDAADYTPYWLFNCGLLNYMLEAVKIRYEEYMRIPF